MLAEALPKMERKAVLAAFVLADVHVAGGIDACCRDRENLVVGQRVECRANVGAVASPEAAIVEAASLRGRASGVGFGRDYPEAEASADRRMERTA